MKLIGRGYFCKVDWCPRMNTQRDSFIRLEARKQNWLRLEFFRRLLSQKFMFKRVLFRALRRDASLSI